MTPTTHIPIKVYEEIKTNEELFSILKEDSLTNIQWVHRKGKKSHPYKVTTITGGNK